MFYGSGIIDFNTFTMGLGIIGFTSVTALRSAIKEILKGNK